MNTVEELKKELPHIIVVALLVVVLFFVLTKLDWINCHQIPGWCPIYCSIAGRSRIALAYGNSGMGNPTALRGEIMRYRPSADVELIHCSELNFNLLKNYELVILEHCKKLSVGRAEALKAYINSGGDLLWIGDSATELFYTPTRIAELKEQSKNYSKNKTTPYEKAMKELKEKQNLGAFDSILFIKYLGERNVTHFYFRRVMNKQDNLMLSGIAKETYLNFTSPFIFSKIEANPVVVSRLMDVSLTNNETYPAFLDIKTTGRIVYLAFPPENLPSHQFLLNIIDYLASCD